MNTFPYRIQVEWSERDRCFVARVPALNVVTHGESAEEATREAQVAAGLMMGVLRDDGQTLPEPDVVF